MNNENNNIETIGFNDNIAQPVDNTIEPVVEPVNMVNPNNNVATPTAEPVNMVNPYNNVATPVAEPVNMVNPNNNVSTPVAESVNMINPNNNVAAPTVEPVNMVNQYNNVAAPTAEPVNMANQYNNVAAPTVEPVNMVNPNNNVATPVAESVNMINPNNNVAAPTVEPANIGFAGSTNIPTQNMNSTNKSNTKIFMLIGIGVLLVIAIVLIIVVVVGRDDKKHNKNEFEENTTTQSQITEEDWEDEEVTDTDKNVYSYKGFDFEKITGYVYGESSGLLAVEKDKFGMALNVTKAKFSDVKSNYKVIETKLKQIDSVVGESKVDTYSNREVVTIEFTSNGNKAIYFVVAAANSEYVYEGFVLNKDNVFDYENINEMIKVINKSKYNGNYSDYSSESDNTFDVNVLLK